MFVMMIGAPLSGKTTLAAMLAETLNAPLVHLENDKLRQARGRHIDQPATYTPAETDATYALARNLARQGLDAGYHVLHDATNLDPEARQASAHLAEAKDVQIVGIHVDTPQDVRAARAQHEGPGARRAHDAIGHRIPRLARSAIPTLTIDGQTPPHDAVDQLLTDPRLAPLAQATPTPG